MNGVTQQTALDAAGLSAIAQAANGTYHAANDAAELAAVYDSIELTDTPRTELTGLAPYFMIAAALLGAAAMALSIVRTGRVIAP